MSLQRTLRFYFIKCNRYLLRRQYMPVMDGPLKGYLWSTRYNYDYLTGEYEDAETLDTFFSWLRPDAVLYDLGGNVGYYAFLAATQINQGHIFSFEPMPDNLSVFREHLSRNAVKAGVSRIQLIPMAVSDQPKEVLFSNDPKRGEGNSYIGHSNEQQGLRIPCTSVDAFVAAGNPAPDVLKIDVEGAELDVLRGAEKTILQNKPPILLATHDYHSPGIRDACVSWLSERGYQLRKLPAHYKIYEGLDDYLATHP